MTSLSKIRALAICVFITAAMAALATAQQAENSRLVGVLKFEVEYDNMVTPMRYYSDGKHLRVELGEAGDPYLIWIRGIEGVDGIAALSPIEKNYSIEHDGPIWDLLRGDGSVERRGKSKDVELPDGEKAEYMGFSCVRYHLKTGGPDTTVWMLDNAESLPFLVTRLWRNLADANPHIVKLSQLHNGVPLKIERKKWGNKAYFSMQLINYDPQVPTKQTFEIPQDYYQVASQIRGGRRGGPSGRDGSEGGKGDRQR